MSSDMTFSFDEMISHVSRYFELLPGDLIWSGTMGTTTTALPGDEYEIELVGITILRNSVVQGH